VGIFKVFGSKAIRDARCLYQKELQDFSNSPDVVTDLKEKSKVE
jgi:hypothetical protein